MFEIFEYTEVETHKDIVEYWDKMFCPSLRCGIEIEVEYNSDVIEQETLCTSPVCRFAKCAPSKKESCFMKKNVGTDCAKCSSFASKLKCDQCVHNAFASFANNFPVNRLNQILFPSKNHIQNPMTGINEIKPDGSLKNGIEITTIGLPISLPKIYQVIKNITDIFTIYGKVDNTCGLHFHILNSYYSAHYVDHYPLPAFILNNVYAITYAFAAAIIFMGATGDSECGFSRYSTFAAPYFPRYYGLKNKEVDLAMKEITPHRGKYGMINVINSPFINDALLSAHVEYRSTGMSLSPYYITGMAMLFAAINYKAYKISRDNAITGVEIDKKTAALLISIYNKGEGQRESDTRPFFGKHPFIKTGPYEENMKIMRAISTSMVDFLSEELNEIDKDAIQLLNNIIENPIFELRIKGETWEEIDKRYSKGVA